MNIQKIRAAIDEDYDGFCKDCFAHWITCMWGKYRDGFTFEENKEAFFYLLERLLREGKVKFDQPDKPEAWDASPEEILEHFRKHWPTSATDEQDLNLHIYLYRMPGIGWLGEDGQWHGS